MSDATSSDLAQHIAPEQMRFGEYTLHRYLCAGGMADLYLARAERFGERELVVKRVQERYLSHGRIVKMFIDEGRIASLLEHPNIVRTLDIGIEFGHYYIAMEYVNGADLVAVARRSVELRQPIPRGVAVGVVAQVAAGLGHAHELGDGTGKPYRIVHCDVSPGNVVVSFRGVAKIVDFGIARATIALREEDGVAGKYNYMAPEQIRGEAVDARADLFSLGVILWELTTQRRLFKGRPEVVLKKILEDPIPSPREVVADYPEELQEIVMRLLARDPGDRWQSAAAAEKALEEYMTVHETGYDRRSVAQYVRALFEVTTPIEGSGLTDVTNLVDDAEVDRGMPTSGEVPRVEPSELEENEDAAASAAPEVGASSEAVLTPEPAPTDAAVPTPRESPELTDRVKALPTPKADKALEAASRTGASSSRRLPAELWVVLALVLAAVAGVVVYFTRAR